MLTYLTLISFAAGYGRYTYVSNSLKGSIARKLKLIHKMLVLDTLSHHKVLASKDRQITGHKAYERGISIESVAATSACRDLPERAWI